MKTSINNALQLRSETKMSLLAFATLAFCILYSISAHSQGSQHKQLLSNVTFQTAYVIKADAATQKEEAARVYESLPAFSITPAEKKNYAFVSPEGDFHFVRYINQDQPEAVSEVCLTVTDLLGNVMWEMKYQGQGLPGESENFITLTKGNKGYFIQRTLHPSVASAASVPENIAAK